MQISRRLQAKDETDHELLWLSVSLGGLIGAVTWLALKVPWPICFFHALTGYPCPTCGATRSAIAFFHGQFFTAWKWNPLAFLAYCALSIFDAYAFVVVVTRAPRLRITHATATEMNFVRIAVVALLAVNWIYLLIANPSL